MAEEDQKAAVQEDIVVFSILKAGACSDCHTELVPGELLRMEGQRPFCIDCADLGHLVFLPSGNVALTRRSRKYSSLSAVVVRFSRARGRYERQGLLVERAALERAESECLSDENARRVARERAATYREKVNARYVEDFSHHVRHQFPNCSPQETLSIAAHACEKHTGRVGRSASARSFEPAAVELAVRAHVRHVHTTYDQLLARGWERDEARTQVEATVAEVMARWRQGISPGETPPPISALQSDGRVGRLAPSRVRR